MVDLIIHKVFIVIEIEKLKNMHLFYLWYILLLSQPTHSVYIPACINYIIIFREYFDVVHGIDEL